MQSEEKKKIDESDRSLLIGLQQRWEALTKRLGELHYSKILLEMEEKSLDAELRGLELDRQKVVEEFQEKYGIGDVDLDTGEFIPAT